MTTEWDREGSAFARTRPGMGPRKAGAVVQSRQVEEMGPAVGGLRELKAHSLLEPC